MAFMLTLGESQLFVFTEGMKLKCVITTDKKAKFRYGQAWKEMCSPRSRTYI